MRFARRPHPTTAGLALIVLVAATILALPGRTSGHATQASPPEPPPSIPDRPEPSLAGGTYRYSIGTIINHDVLPDSSPAILATERVVSIDDNGYAKYYVATTTTLDGALWQEQHFDGQRLILNQYERPGDRAACTESSPARPSGSTLPLMRADELTEIGFRPASMLPAEVERHLTTFDGHVSVFMRDGRPGADGGSRTSYLAWHEATGQSVGQWNYGRIQGTTVLVDSQELTLLERVPAGDFAIETFGPCDGGAGAPAANSTPSGDGKVPTPTPAITPDGHRGSVDQVASNDRTTGASRASG